MTGGQCNENGAVVMWLYRGTLDGSRAAALSKRCSLIGEQRVNQKEGCCSNQYHP